MKGFIKKYWILIVVLAVFIFFKIPHLFYPYYWDESWPYAPAIKQMLHHGISLMPGAVEAELSRGHPLFFHAIAAAWMQVFGSSHVAMHSFALTISILFLIAVYEAGLRLFSQRTATLALLLVSTQVVFFVQSSFVLFEILVAFLCFLSLYFYARNKYVLTAITLSALFYTKESGLIAGFIIGICALIDLFNKALPVRERIYKLLSVGMPCLLIGIFFLLQKHIMGWYIFPFYSGLIEHSWKIFWYKLRMGSIRVSFYENLKFWYFILLMLLAIVAAIKNKAPKYLAVLLPGICIYYFVDDMRAGRLLPPIPFFIVFILSVVYFLYIYSGPLFFPQKQQRKFIILAAAFIFCFLCFSTMNYFTYRYLLATIVPLLFITAAFLDVFITHIHKAVYGVILLCIAIVSFCSFRQSTSIGDADLGAFNGMDVEQGIINFLEQQNAYDKPICSSSFLERQHLTDPATGFLHGRTFTNVKWDLDSTTRFIIFTNIEEDKRYSDIKNDPSFRLTYRIAKGEAWGEVYERK